MRKRLTQQFSQLESIGKNRDNRLITGLKYSYWEGMRRMARDNSSVKMYEESFLDTGKHLSYDCLAEDTYQTQMQEVVEAYLGQRVTSGINNGIYYEFYGQAEPKGTIVISFGFTESAEKYHELIYYMYREGYQAAVIDHRGHGKSLREVEDSQLVHVEDFGQYVEDFHRVIKEIILPKAGNAPLYLYAHSMGGCIGTLYLEQHPEIFQKAVLNTPMYGINNGGVPDFAARLLCRGAMLLGKKKEKLFTMGSFDREEPFETSGCDSKARHEYYLLLRREHEEYQTSCATYAWANAAMCAGRRAIASANAALIRIPVLLFQATEDTFVRSREQDLFLSRVPGARKVMVKSRHEVNRMPADRLGAYMAEIFEFYK